MPLHDRIGAIYDFVRNEIDFGYNRADDIPASEVLDDRYGQCNTKGTLLMALLRAVGVRCRLHGFTIHKALQRGVVPELIYPIAPAEILHSWIEVETEAGWVDLEGFILDTPFLLALQRSFPETRSLCGYGAGTDCLSAPPVGWTGRVHISRRPASPAILEHSIILTCFMSTIVRRLAPCATGSIGTSFAIG